MNLQDNFSSKFTNAHSGWAPWLGKKHGEYIAILQTSCPQYRPDYLGALSSMGGAFLKARFAATALERIAMDQNILTVELREHVALV